MGWGCWGDGRGEGEREGDLRRRWRVVVDWAGCLDIW